MSNQADLHHVIDAAVALNTQAITSNTTTVGIIIDLKGKLAVDFAILAGTMTDGTYTAKLEEGDAANLSDAADVPTNRLLGGPLPVILAAEDNTVQRIGFFKSKRFVRLSLVSTGASTGGTLGALVIINPDLTVG